MSGVMFIDDSRSDGRHNGHVAPCPRWMSQEDSRGYEGLTAAVHPRAGESDRSLRGLSGPDPHAGPSVLHCHVGQLLVGDDECE